MKRIALLAAASTLVSISVLRADDQPRNVRTDPPPGDVRGADQPRGARTDPPPGDGRTGRREISAATYIETIDKQVSLTDDQKKAMTAIFESRDKSIKEFESENAEKMKTASKAMQDAIAGNDREAIGKAQQEYRDVFGPMHELMRKANDDLTNVLTDDQKAKLQQIRVEAGIKDLAGPVTLTDEQMKQLVALVNGNEGVRGVLQEKVAPALEQMLTPEQKTALTKYQVIRQVERNLGGGRLTREQMKQLDTDYDELAKDATLKKDDLVKQLMEKGTALLTDEQKQAVNDAASHSGARGR